jgi:hypothetical protein
MKRAKEAVAKSNKEREEMADRLYCPKHNKTMRELGCMGIRNMEGDAANLNGDYCLVCYQTWIASNVPKFEEKSILIP